MFQTPATHISRRFSCFKVLFPLHYLAFYLDFFSLMQAMRCDELVHFYPERKFYYGEKLKKK